MRADKEKLIIIAGSRSNYERMDVAAAYKKKYGTDIRDAIREKCELPSDLILAIKFLFCLDPIESSDIVKQQNPRRCGDSDEFSEVTRDMLETGWLLARVCRFL